jgi:hypothetical protein
MIDASALLLIAAVAAVGVLHTIVPDHWVPITLIARQRGWSRAETARASLKAGAGHVLSTLVIALVVWLAGVAAAEQYGHIVDIAANLALIAFGGWFAVAAWPGVRRCNNAHRHTHSHGHDHSHAHGDQPARSIGEPWRFEAEHYAIERTFDRMALAAEHHGHDHASARASEVSCAPADEDGLYAPAATAVAIRHCHPHRHGKNAPPHTHSHDHISAEAHPPGMDAPLHQHRHKTTGRAALLLILGSSPMVEGIPAFFAAGRYGVQLLSVLAVVFAASTIGTYVLLCVCSTAGLQRVRLGPLERYGEVLSGALISAVGLVFLIWPAF